MLLEYSVLACAPMRLGRLVYPMHVTPLSVTITSSFTCMHMHSEDGIQLSENSFCHIEACIMTRNCLCSFQRM